MKPKTNSDTTPKLYVGLDVHKQQTSVAVADPGAQGEIRSRGSILTCLPSIEKLLRRLAKAKGIILKQSQFEAYRNEYELRAKE